jgi:radical SAM superfamily enzyme YgiQ (UPF0313 family)
VRNNLKVTFIVPSWHYYLDPFKHQPYWEMYYATYVRLNGYNVSIFDMRSLEKDDFINRLEKIEKSDFYFFWIFKTGDAKEIYSIADYLKKKFKDCVTAAGGTHVDMCQTECQKYFDSIIVGPGENSFSNIISDRKINVIKKIYEEDYKNIPFRDTSYPDRSFYNPEKVISKKLFDQYGEYNGALVYFSRGCIFKCAYCTYNVPRLLQVKSPEMIKSEINYLKKNYNVNAILLKDEIAISPNSKVSKETLTAIAESEVVWRGQTITTATYEQLKLAKESGCLELAIGVETVDNQVMKIIDKTWQTDKIIRLFIENSKKLELNVKICLIFGLPGEPEDILEKTINFLDETKPEYVSVSGFLPVPGSPIERNPEKYGIKFIDKDWTKYGHLLYRFSDEEDVGLPFEYHENSPWGKAFNNEKIKYNITYLQKWLKSKGMSY